MKSLLLLLLVPALVLFTGCAKDADKKAAMQTESDKAKNEFENQKDPPVNANTRYAAGQLAETQGNLPLAAQQYKEALKLDPKFTLALYRQGVVLAQLKDYQAA